MEILRRISAQKFDGTWRKEFDGKGRSRFLGDLVPKIDYAPSHRISGATSHRILSDNSVANSPKN